MSKVPTMRLDRLLGNLGYGSRKEMHGLAAAGEIVLDGVAVKDAGARIAILCPLRYLSPASSASCRKSSFNDSSARRNGTFIQLRQRGSTALR